MPQLEFSPSEIAEIREMLAAKEEATGEEKKAIRGQLRQRFGLRISELDQDGSEFTASDFDERIRDGTVRVRNHWLFQANPRSYDLAAGIAESEVGSQDSWPVTRLGGEMEPGDGVVLWSAGQQAGAYALADIDGPLFDRPHSGYTQPGSGQNERAAPLRISFIPTAPILRRELESHPELSDLMVIRSPTGTNFRVTGKQWNALMQLMEQQTTGQTWWVNQGRSYRDALISGALWAPAVTKAGIPASHHVAMTELKVGDVVISYSNSAIRALIRVKSPTVQAGRPYERPAEEKGRDGYLSEVRFFELDTPIQLSEIPSDLRTPASGPFTEPGSVKEGYLFRLGAPAADQIREQFKDRWPPGSPWADLEALAVQARHLILKWSADIAADTIERHRSIADAEASVWWGKFGAGLGADSLRRFQTQLRESIPTSVFLYRQGDTWRTQLQEITDNPDEVNDELRPDYYSKEDCGLFVRLADFEHLEDNWPDAHLHLADDPDPARLSNALRRGSSALFIVKMTAAELPSSAPTKPPSTLEELSQLTLWEIGDLEDLLASIDKPGQVVLAGPPGTGKTWVAESVANYLIEADESRTSLIQFHPSYGYEEFIEGLRPSTDAKGNLVFAVEPGAIRRIVTNMDPSEPYVLVIDEMNRANLPRVLGELMYLFEYRDKKVNLQYTPGFELPKSLKFIGTMNTADRSIRAIDIALRRRFDVFECSPSTRALERWYARDENNNHVPSLLSGFETLNATLSEELDRHHTIGHTFFMAEHMTPTTLRRVWTRKLGPLIEEYFFDQADRAAAFTAEQFWSELA